jgi:hypothetical protein
MTISQNRFGTAVPKASETGLNLVPPLTLTGPMLVGLMRLHRVKIRDLKAKYGLTLKRVRQVRSTGLTGFAAEEWVFPYWDEHPPTEIESPEEWLQKNRWSLAPPALGTWGRMKFHH